MFVPNLKTVAPKPVRLAKGHRLCPGCGIGAILKQVLAATDDPVIISNATGCSEICTSNFPYNSWKTPWIHSLFENAASVASGIDALKKAKERKGELSDLQKRSKILAVGGDGATYDIGLQWLSGALERGHDFVYLCFDNEGYMNTGYQRSSATPFGAATTTSPNGEVIHGKQQQRKDLTAIIDAHHIPYVAQGEPSFFADLMMKANKAFETPGPAFINTLAVCPTNWKCDTQTGLRTTKMAVETCFWPLFEIVNGKLRITYRPKEKLPITAWLEGQKRFRHLLKPENKHLLDEAQKEVDIRWEALVARHERDQAA